jgi:hypothetical protein
MKLLFANIICIKSKLFRLFFGFLKFIFIIYDGLLNCSDLLLEKKHV